MKTIIFYILFFLGNFLELFYKKKQANLINKNPSVSIIITNYNYGKFVEESIETALNQSYKNKEIIIIDDNSNDKYTIFKLKKLKNKYSKFKNIKFYFLKKNVGLPAARNFGIKKSKGSIICCLDADDKLKSDYVRKCVEILTNPKNSNIGIVYSYTKFFGKENFVWKPLKANLLLIRKYNCIAVSAIFRKDVWISTNGYREDLKLGYEDWDFWYRALKSGWRVYLIKKILFYHRIHNKNMVKFSIKHHKQIVKKIFYESIREN